MGGTGAPRDPGLPGANVPLRGIGTPRWRSSGGLTGLRGVAEGASLHDDDVGVVEQAVKHGGDARGIAEEPAPVVDGPVRVIIVLARS